VSDDEEAHVAFHCRRLDDRPVAGDDLLELIDGERWAELTGAVQQREV
jgi:hypothetical protein